MATWSGNWQQQILQGVGAPITPENLRAVNAWAQAEGGTAAYNPFNTTEVMPGSSMYNHLGNGIGVQSYSSPQQGITATVKTLQNGHYAPILAALKSGDNAMAVGQAIAASPWGTGEGVLRVLGDQSPLGGSSPIGISGVLAPGSQGRQVNMPAAQPSLGPIPKAMLPPSYKPIAAPGIMPSPGLMPTGLFSAANMNQLATQFLGPGHGIHNLTPTQQSQQPVRTAVSPNGTQVEFQGRVQARDMAAVHLADSFVNKTPYVWGGTSPSGFDCSGLIQYVWGKQGVQIPRTTYEQFEAGTPVAKKNLQPGDAVFFTGSDPQNGLPGHVGMYIGGGKFVEAPHTGADVRVSKLAGRTDYVGARSFAPGQVI